MLNAARASKRRSGAQCLVLIGRIARRVERSVWSMLVSLLWPAVFALMAAIAGMVGRAAVTPMAALEPKLLLSLLLVLFALVVATVLLGADAEPRQ